MLTPYKQFQSTFDCKTSSVLPVDEAVANLIAALDGESVLAFSSAPSDEESTVHLDRRTFQRNTVFSGQTWLISIASAVGRSISGMSQVS